MTQCGTGQMLALYLYNEHPARWRALRQRAAAARFRWSDGIEAYLEQRQRIGGDR